MTQSQFSLSWGAHKSNICAGLSSLQQNGEFVDLTLAADGHHVKVHQVIMALSSPYIKELISTANCPHPVILLNKISYEILSAILEYIYTGEVLISIENLSELIRAGKELHIKGLEDMKFNPGESTTVEKIEFEKEPLPPSPTVTQSVQPDERDETIPDEFCYFEITTSKDDDEKYVIYDADTANNTHTDDLRADSMDENLEDNTFEETMQTDVEMRHDSMQQESNVEMMPEEDNEPQETPSKISLKPPKSTSNKRATTSDVSVMQYTVSNQGSLQMILNRFVYYLKHTKRDGTRHWRCVEYLTPSRCPAQVITRDDVVTNRISAHIHCFHDKKILKKVQDGAIFTAIKEAVKEGISKKSRKGVN